MILKDESNIIADGFGAQVTPEVFLFDNSMILRCHSAMGNSKNPTTKPHEARPDESKSALSKSCSNDCHKMFGCINRKSDPLAHSLLPEDKGNKNLDFDSTHCGRRICLRRKVHANERRKG
jgi:hypothetical protein